MKSVPKAAASASSNILSNLVKTNPKLTNATIEITNRPIICLSVKTIFYPQIIAII